MKSHANDAPNGYVIHLYQYAHRYRYNNDGCLNFFNYLIDRRNSNNEDPHDLDSDFVVFGDFDLLQIVRVNSFREYHDVSALAKEWLGKRQSVLLYDISNGNSRIYYDETNKAWKEISGTTENKVFFCLTMLSLTNEIIEKTDDISALLGLLRIKIIEAVDYLNEQCSCNIGCEVYGTFNSSELGIVWLCNQYIDVLHIVNYIKHIKIVDKSGSEESAFHNSFSIISTKEDSNAIDVKGEALVEITEQELIPDYNSLKKIVDQIVENPQNIYYSVGKHDVALCMDASIAIRLIKRAGALAVGVRNPKTGHFKIEKRQILSNNICLLYRDDDNTILRDTLCTLEKKGGFQCIWERVFRAFNRYLDWEEFKQEELKKTADLSDKTNAQYYNQIRRLLKENVSSSAGAVDSLDLLYTDYYSAVASSYSAMWCADLHQQFKSVLEAMWNLISQESIPGFWDSFLELTNAFKQQIYHISQSNQLFFHVPNCHLRSTGQFDFLMHAYYGITKKIIESIYLIQGNDRQSELVPLITVNTVPQVRSQLYFELGSHDDRRVVNLDIPNSVIFDLQRGVWYLSHELYHYAAPGNRRKRNYLMGVWLLSDIFLQQYLCLMIRVLSIGKGGLVDNVIESKLKTIYGYSDENDMNNENTPSILDDLKTMLMSYIIKHYSVVEAHLHDLGSICSDYQRSLILFSMGEESESFFTDLFHNIFPIACNQLYSAADKVDNDIIREKVIDRIKYCILAKTYMEQYITTQIRNRFPHINSCSKETESLTISSCDDLTLLKWRGIREACSDIAMITLNHIPAVDYLLFCVQTLTDSRKNRNYALSEMKCPNEIPQWIRFGLVIEYCVIHNEKHRIGWNLALDPEKELLDEKSSVFFIRKYIWLFSHNNTKKNRLIDNDFYINEIKRLREDAIEWIEFFASCRNYYLANYSRDYDLLFSPILEFYDIFSIIMHQKDMGDKRCEKLQTISNDFGTLITKRYLDLFNQSNYNLLENDFATNHDALVSFYQYYHTERFRLDISAAQLFQTQISLYELMELNKKLWDSPLMDGSMSNNYTIPIEEYNRRFNYISSGPDNESEKCWTFHVRSLEELLFYVKFVTNQLRGQEKQFNIPKSDSMIWFRGHSNEKYKLYPTVMRKYEKSEWKKYLSLRNFHQSNFEVFKFRADGTLEIPSGIQFTKSDYIALMQHYSVPSNFLDWTDNAFTSLFMALKYFINSNRENQRNVVLFLFHPGLYNAIRREVISEEKPILAGQAWFDSLSDPNNNYSCLIPNLSITENENRYNAFLLGDVSFDSFVAKGKSCDYCPNNHFLPIAILTSRLNPRIQTQNGNFVAFNLYTPPNENKTVPEDKNEKDLYQYISLEAIQERMIKKGLFLYKIVIDADCCSEVVAWLRSLGISKENIYPELSEKSYHFS